jgi:hypothetical protein
MMSALGAQKRNIGFVKIYLAVIVYLVILYFVSNNQREAKQDTSVELLFFFILSIVRYSRNQRT